VCIFSVATKKMAVRCQMKREEWVVAAHRPCLRSLGKKEKKTMEWWNGDGSRGQISRDYARTERLP